MAMNISATIWNLFQDKTFFFQSLSIFDQHIGNLELPAPSQQSASDGKGNLQLLEPQIKSPLHSLSESQSPWLRSHWLVDEQHV